MVGLECNSLFGGMVLRVGGRTFWGWIRSDAEGLRQWLIRVELG
jgi:hypothetical protein